MHDLDQLHARQRRTHGAVDLRPDPVNQLQHLRPAAPCMLDDPRRVGLAGQEERGHRRANRPANLGDPIVSDHARATRHGPDQAERVDAVLNRKSRLVARSDAADLDPGPTHGAALPWATLSETSPDRAKDRA
jgi:hypothetical protein